MLSQVSGVVGTCLLSWCLDVWNSSCWMLKFNFHYFQAPRSTMTPDFYSKCTLLDIKKETHDSNLYTFDCHGFIDMKPGQHLILRYKDYTILTEAQMLRNIHQPSMLSLCREVTDTGSLTRQYTPVHLPNPSSFTFQVVIKVWDVITWILSLFAADSIYMWLEGMSFDMILVSLSYQWLIYYNLFQLYESGPMSELIRKRWKVGYKADWRGPNGLFLHHPNKVWPYS